jgi:hypothetical protein
VISRETLFHYYVWGFLKLFGFNILSYEVALFVIWVTLLYSLSSSSTCFSLYIVTSVTALVFNFLPFAFIYVFWHAIRWPWLWLLSLYFLHVGFRNGRHFAFRWAASLRVCGYPFPAANLLGWRFAPLWCVLLESLRQRLRGTRLVCRIWISGGCCADFSLYLV